MGLDLTHQGFPVRTGLLELMRERADNWEEQLALFASGFWDSPWLENSGALALEPVRRTLDLMPDPKSFRFSLRSRSHEKIEWMLGTHIERQVKDFGARSKTFPYQVVFGEELVAEHARAGQGIPIRFSSSEFVVEAAEYLESQAEVDLRKRFDLAQMLERGVYKSSKNDAFEEIYADLVELTAFYRRVAQAGFWLAVSLD